MLYSLVENEMIGEPQSLPTEVTVSAGSVLNFNTLSADQARLYGYLPVNLEQAPEFDADTEKLVRTLTVSMDGQQVDQAYDVVELSSSELTARLDAERASLHADRQVIAAQVLGAGMPVTLEGNAETLQCRDERDRTNWLALQARCGKKIAAGLGAETIAVGVRCTSNAEYFMSWQECDALLDMVFDWAAFMQGANWAVEAMIDAAPNVTALRAINIPAVFIP